MGEVDKNLGSMDKGAEGDPGAPAINYETLYEEASKSILELTAERDSLLSENETLRKSRDAAIEDSAKTKEMNYTLSRQLNIQQATKKQPEDILAAMFIKKGE